MPYKFNDLVSDGAVVHVLDQDNNREILLKNSGELTLKQTHGNVQASYTINSTNELVSQQALLVNTQEEVEIQYLLNEDCWDNAFLGVNGQTVALFNIMPANADPETNIIYNSSEGISDLPFDGKMFRWTEGVNSYNHSSTVSRIITEAKEFLSESMTVEKVCKMFDMNMDDLSALPDALVQQKKQVSKMGLDFIF